MFLHGVIGDGDLDWQLLMPYLSDRFTCHLPSLRGRGLSADHPDLGIDRLAEDVVAYVDSLEARSGLVGWSLGADVALLAAGVQSDAVAAVVVVEPSVMSSMNEQERAAFRRRRRPHGRAGRDGHGTAEVRAFAGFVFDDEEIAVAVDAGYLEAAGRYVPKMLSFFQQQRESAEARADDPAVLGAICAPVLVLHGADTRGLFTRSARHVADHVPDATLQAIPGAGHASPLTQPEALAEALTGFFSPR